MREDFDQRANDASSARGKAGLGALQGSGLRHLLAATAYSQ